MRTRWTIAFAAILALLAQGCAGSGASATPKRSLVPDWTKTVSSVCVESPGQPYPGIDDGPMVAVVERLADRTGIRVATTGDCDATLTVTLTFTPLYEYYGGIMGASSGNCYTGAAVAGSLKLQAPGKTPVSLAVSAEKKPPTNTIIYTCPAASQAPFDSVWPRPLVEALWTLLGDEVADAAIADSDPAVRAIGVGMLSGRPSSDVVPVLLGLLKDSDATVRAQVTYALRDRRPDSAEVIDALISALSDPSDVVRIGAAEALGAIGPAASAAVPALTDLLDDSHSLVVDNAAKAIEKITGAKPSGFGCTVPDVKGKTIAEARALWQAAGFSSGVNRVGTGDYRISDQDPRAGEIVDCRTFIPLLVLP